MAEDNIMRCIRKTDPSYPEILKNYSRMPERLYVIGDLPDPKLPGVAIVGARGCSAYGRAEAERFGRCLAQHGVKVISGMAYGIDAWAHHGALEGGGRTFAVLGTGADVVYPRENTDLYRRILQHGGVLSEFEPGVRAEPWHFPLRNRVISALADIVLVIEAKARSGSLITVEYALEQGKSVYAVPGRNRDKLSEGTNRLIAQGAGIAWTPEILLEELGLLRKEEYSYSAIPIKEEKEKGKKKAVLRYTRKEREEAFAYHLSRQSTEAAMADGRPKTAAADQTDILPPAMRESREIRRLFQCLNDDDKSVDRLMAESGLPVQTVTAVLLQLCFSGYVEERIPGYYCRIRG